MIFKVNTEGKASAADKCLSISLWVRVKPGGAWRAVLSIFLGGPGLSVSPAVRGDAKNRRVAMRLGNLPQWWNLREKTARQDGSGERRPEGRAATGTLQDFTPKKTWGSWRM